MTDAQHSTNLKIWADGNWETYCDDLLRRADCLEQYAIDLLNRATALRELTKWEKPE